MGMVKSDLHFGIDYSGYSMEPRLERIMGGWRDISRMAWQNRLVVKKERSGSVREKNTQIAKSHTKQKSTSYIKI